MDHSKNRYQGFVERWSWTWRNTHEKKGKGPGEGEKKKADHFLVPPVKKKKP